MFSVVRMILAEEVVFTGYFTDLKLCFESGRTHVLMQNGPIGETREEKLSWMGKMSSVSSWRSDRVRVCDMLLFLREENSSQVEKKRGGGISLYNRIFILYTVCTIGVWNSSKSVLSASRCCSSR
ncbi:unnamed protein product [Sphacelaria rigidula]